MPFGLLYPFRRAVILPDTEPDAAREVAGRICQTYPTLAGARGAGAGAAVSIGSAVYPDDGTTEDQLFRVADGRLYADRAAAARTVGRGSTRADEGL